MFVTDWRNWLCRNAPRVSSQAQRRTTCSHLCSQFVASPAHLARSARGMSAEEEEPDDDDSHLAAIRPIFRSIYSFIDLSTAVTYSSEDTRALKLGRDGFTYGETSLSSVRRVLDAVDLSSFPSGATILDLGSGIGNVVAAVALLAASGALGNGHITCVRGVELLPSLHGAALEACKRLRAWAEDAAGRAQHSLHLSSPLPRIELECSDLEHADLSEVDVVYMASTVFEDDVIQRFTARAAASLKPGAKVVTLASPLRHPAFGVQGVVGCNNSWGEEDAYVNVVRASDDRPAAADDGVAHGVEPAKGAQGEAAARRPNRQDLGALRISGIAAAGLRLRTSVTGGSEWVFRAGPTELG